MSDVTIETQAAKKFDPEAFAMNLARAMETSGQALAAFLKPRETGEVTDKPPNEMTEVIKTFSTVAEYWLSDNDRTTELQAKIAKAYLDLWGSSMRRLAGQEAPLQGSRVEIEPVFRFRDAALSAYHGMRA
jgi:polyhydroxyalkanoate synthase